MAAQPLSSKVEFILEEIMAGFGLVRQEVNIDVLEFSESDDDYWDISPVHLADIHNQIHKKNPTYLTSKLKI